MKVVSPPVNHKLSVIWQRSENLVLNVTIYIL